MTALAINALNKSFGGLRVTRSVSLAVEPGERRLIIGPNGAGKTTLFNLITGEIAPDDGSIMLFGRDITRVPSHQRAHLGMARTYQIITLFGRDTILRNVTLALLGLSPLRWDLLTDLDAHHHLVDSARAALARVGLDHIAHRPLSQTSYGERRRVEIAMALAQNPKVLLLDEPFAGLSIDERRDEFRRQTADRRAEHKNVAGARRQQADRDVHAGGLAGAVAAEQAEQPADAGRERDLRQHVAVAVIGVDLAEAERGVSGQGRPRGCADRRPPRRACPRR